MGVDTDAVERIKAVPFPDLAHLSSAGEEVSDDDITIALENFATEKGYSNDHGDYMGDADLFEDGFMTAIEWMRSKLTHQPVSEEEIDEMFPLEADKFMFKASEEYNKAQIHRREGAKAIVELLNR